MAFSYIRENEHVGYSDESVTYDWYYNLAITEEPWAPLGKIRLKIVFETRTISVYPASYVVYSTDTISYNGEKFNVHKGTVSKSYDYTEYIDVPNYWAGETISTTIGHGKRNILLSASESYALSISAGTGVSIDVTRMSSDKGDYCGYLPNGSNIYSGDILKIEFTPLQNYGILEHTVNDITFESGGAMQVNGHVYVYATAMLLASDVGATDAYIESVSTITVTRHSNTFVHSLQYAFGSLSGYINNDGTISSLETRYTDTSIAFTVPSAFYAQIPNSKNDICTITCKTYESTEAVAQLGESKTCTFIASASPLLCAPTVSGSVEDTNSVTSALTGDNTKLVRYKSNAVCTITASARNSATIVSKTVNGIEIQNSSISIAPDDLSMSSFVFSAVDSRGFESTYTVTTDMIPYIKLSINPVLRRPLPTSGEVSATINGKFYNGSFGSKTNQLTIKYRYRDVSSASWSSWVTLDTSGFVIGTENYASSGEVKLKDVSGSDTGFNYHKSYLFELAASDGFGENVLSTVTSTAKVQRGIPVFDWGENDFRFNVPIILGETQLTEAQLKQLLSLIQS